MKVGGKVKKKDAIGEIFSNEWKRKAFKFVVRECENPYRFVSGYELFRKFKVSSLSSVYDFIDKMVKLGVFRYPIEGSSRKVRITDFGKELYIKIEPLL
jgi:hypothetical protein